MTSTPWSDPTADPYRDLTEARRLAAAGAPPTYGASTAAASLYLTGYGRDVARALGVPVTVSHVLNYGDVLEDRTTGELRLIVGTANPPSDHDLTLAAVRRDAIRIVHRGLAGYGDPRHHERQLKAVDLEAAFDRIRRPAVAAALKLDPRHAPRRRGYVEGGGVRIDF